MFNTVNYSSNSIKIKSLTILKEVDAESLRPPPNFQVTIKIQLDAACISRLSFRFLWL